MSGEERYIHAIDAEKDGTEAACICNYIGSSPYTHQVKKI